MFTPLVHPAYKWYMSNPSGSFTTLVAVTSLKIIRNQNMDHSSNIYVISKYPKPKLKEIPKNSRPYIKYIYIYTHDHKIRLITFAPKTPSSQKQYT